MKRRPWFLACLAVVSAVLLAIGASPAQAAPFSYARTLCETSAVHSEHTWKVTVCQEFSFTITPDGTRTAPVGKPGVRAFRQFYWFWVPSTHLCRAWVNQADGRHVVKGGCDGSVYTLTGRALNYDLASVQLSVPVLY